MATVSLYPVGDSFVSSRKPKENYNGEDFLYTGSVGDRFYRALLQFNLALIPADATITSATLNLYIWGNSYPAATKVFNIHRISSDYSFDTVTYKNQPSFDPTIANSFTITTEVSTTINVDLSTLAREWHLGAYENYGILIKANIEGQNNRLGLGSVEISTESLRPTLEIEYTLTGAAASVQIDGHTFSTSSSNGSTGTSYTYTAGQNVGSLSLYNYFITNTGASSATVKLQISPDNSTWLDDTPETEIAASASLAITVSHLTRYIRLGYRSTTPGSDTTLTYWFQTQA